MLVGEYIKRCSSVFGSGIFKQSIFGDRERADCFYNILKDKDPKNIFEIGTFNGLTAVYMALLFPSATVYTLDIIRRPEISSIKAHFRILNLVEILCTLQTRDQVISNFRNIDLVLIDAVHNYDNVKHDYSIAKKICPDGVIIFDDSNMNDIPKFMSEIKANLEGQGKIAWKKNTPAKDVKEK